MDRQPSDTELAARVALLGDRRAFDRLVCRHQSRLRRFFMAQTLGDAQLSDDLAQDTLTRVSRPTWAWRASAGSRRSPRGYSA